jgi:uncharacterized YccA/Bax inhibitor family protein
MALFKSGNPVLNEKAFNGSIDYQQTEVMTEKGTLNKFGLMLILLFASASFTWKAAAEGKDVIIWLIASLIIGFIVALVLNFKKQWGSILAPVYALAEGVFLGGISAYYNHAFDKVAPGIIMQAVGLTFGVVIAMFALYRFGIIKATEKFKSIVIVATAGVGIFYLLSMILRMFGIDMPFIHEGSTMGIVFSLIVVGIAALNLILDFDLIEQGAKQGAPKYMEWFGAFALMVTIVWLYLEILRLLSKLASRK